MPEPKQIEIARSLIGTHEGDNPVITGFARKIGELYPEMKSYAANYTSDGIAWCGVFVAYCMAMSGIRPVFGPTDTDKWMWAQAWKGFGSSVSSPQIGDVLVLARHVTMFAGNSMDGRYIGLGGNQSDSVKESLYSRGAVESIRRPPQAVQAGQEPDKPAPGSAYPEIKIGTTGPIVSRLQGLLGIEQDGEFGPDTDAAVRAFQIAHDLDVDGEVGPATWAVLMSINPTDKLGEKIDMQSSKGSWYSQYSGKYEWRDTGDAPGSAALGVPDDAQGIARPGRDTLGSWFMVRAPNGKVSIEQQTDLGPAAFTGRTIDISSAAAERFGYSPQNFPTDSIFTFWPAPVPPEVAGLSKQNQAIQYRDIRKGLPMPDPVVPQPAPPPQPDPKPTPIPQPQPQLPAVLSAGIDLGRILQFVSDHEADAHRVLTIAVNLHNQLHPDKPVMVAAQPAATGESTTHALLRPSVLLSGGAGIAAGILQWFGHLPAPGAESLTGTLTTMVPIVSTALGLLGGWGAIAGKANSVIAPILLNALQPKAK